MLKEVSQPFIVLGSTSVSATTTVTSSISNILYKDTVGYQVNLSGTPVGTLQVNGSLDYSPGLPQSGSAQNTGNWATITSLAVASGTLSPVIFNLNQLSPPYTQIQFISSTSSGVIDCRFVAKSLG